MDIITPSVELWIPKSYNQHIARCARVCYRKESGDDEALINNLNTRKHLSPFRHFTKYYIVLPSPETIPLCQKLISAKTISKLIGIDIKIDHISKVCYIVANGQWLKEYQYTANMLKFYEVNANYFNSTEIGHNMMRYTLACTTQISTSRELNRVSPNNIIEQSTRYVYEDGTLCKPYWMVTDKYDDTIKDNYIKNCDKQFNAYKKLIDKGMKKEDARGVLPLDTATKVIYTYSIEEWKNIIDLRYYSTTGKPHPNAKYIAGLIRDKINSLGYDL